MDLISGNVERILQNLFVEDKAFSVCPSKDGNLWIGSINNPLLKINPNTKAIVHQTPSFKSITWSVLEDKNGRLWLGQDKFGLFYYDKY